MTIMKTYSNNWDHQRIPRFLFFTWWKIIVFSLLPLCREAWAEGHHRAFPSDDEKLSVSPSSIISSETIKFLPAQWTLLGTWPWPLTSLWKRAGIGQNNISLCLSIHDTKDTKKFESLSCKSYSVTLSLSLDCDKAEGFYFVLVWALTQASRGFTIFSCRFYSEQFTVNALEEQANRQ